VRRGGTLTEKEGAVVWAEAGEGTCRHGKHRSKVPRVSGRGRNCSRRGEGAGGAGEAGEAEEGGDGQHDAVVEEMHVHNRERSKCVDCRDASICESSRRSSCKDCGVASICEHNRERSKCADCGGVSICEHDRRRSICKDCGGASK
jgi:hypothetical protein